MAIKIPLITEFDGKGISEAVKEFKQLETKGQKAAFAIKKAAIPAAAALTGLAVAGFDMAKAAIEDEKSAANLARQLKASTKATDSQVKSTEDLISKMTLATGVADTDLRDAMAILARGMGDTELASKNLQTAMDISAATGKDLTGVAEALSKAYNGNEGALARLDPALRDAVKAGADFDELGRQLNDTFGGAAAAAAETTEGKFKRLQTRFEETKEEIGQALIPIIEALIPYLESAANWVADNSDKLKVLVPLVAGFAGAILAVNAGMKLYTAFTTLAAGAQWAFNAAVAANPIVLIVGGIAVAVGAIFAFRKQIKDLFDEFDQFMNKFGFLGKIAGAAGKAAMPGVRGIQGLAGLFNKIPGLADGGVVTKPTLAVIGEAGPEAVVPLNRAGGMGGVTINVNGGDPQAVVDALRRYMFQNGVVPIRTAA